LRIDSTVSVTHPGPREHGLDHDGALLERPS
jgi:hypothetical protein